MLLFSIILRGCILPEIAESTETVVARIDERTKGMQVTLQSIDGRLVIVEKSSNKSSYDLTKIESLERVISTFETRISYLEKCRLEQNAKTNVISVIWSTLNQPAVVLIIFFFIWVYTELRLR
jgi:hypothetical protein